MPMKKETKDVLLVAAIGFAAMFALPVAYRVWIHYNPPPERKPLLVMLNEASGARRVVLLEMPTDKWTDSDKRLAPDVLEWLERHGEVILPWEWTDVAKKKDWKGYCGSWRRIIKEQLTELTKLIEWKSDVVGDASDKARMARKRIADAMNLKKRVDDEWLPLAEKHERERDDARAAMEELSKVREGISAALVEIAAAEKAGHSVDGLPKDFAKRLLVSIATAYKYHVPKSEMLPRWLPNRVRNWFSMHGGAAASSLRRRA